MLCTIKIDRLGCLHIWKQKDLPPTPAGESTFNLCGKESDLFIQNDDDIKSIFEYLDGTVVKEIEAGWCAFNIELPSEYFPE